jgi:serine/threonine protein kinase
MPERRIPDTELDALLRALGARIQRGDLGRMLRCGPFTLIHPIGRGGVAQVFAAVRDGDISPNYAVKLFDPGIDAEDMLARFEEERRIIRSIRHPGIIAVVDSGMHDSGSPWFAMPLIDGSAITRESDDRTLTLAERLSLAVAACEGLAAAHACGIVHRDVKPGNVITSCRGTPHQVRLIDFGLARAMAGRRPRLTPAGAVHRMGTPEYMAPEQWTDGIASCDARADVFAFGIMLGELLAGVVPRRTQAVPRATTRSSGRRAKAAPAPACAPSEALSRQMEVDPSGAKAAARRRGIPGVPDLLRLALEVIDPLVAPLIAKSPVDRPSDASAVLPLIEAARRTV